MRRRRMAGAAPALLAVAVVAGVRAAVSLGGYLYTDDFILRYLADTDFPSWGLLTQSYNGHVNPVGWLALWFLQWAFPGSHSALVVFTVGVWAITLALAAWLGWQLTRRSIGAVLIVLLAGLSSLGFETSVWWAASMYAIPYQLFLVGCLLSFVNALRRGSRSWLWSGLFCYVAAVLSYSRGFLLGLLVFALVASLPVSGSEKLGARGAWQWARGFWMAMAVVSAAATGAVWQRAEGQFGRPDPVDLLAQVWNLLHLNVLPALWGGPWQWTPVDMPGGWPSVVANPAPGRWAVWACLLGTGLAFAWIWHFRSYLRGYLVWSCAFSSAVLFAAGLARAGNPFASEAYRYTFDLIWPLGLLAVLAVVPLWWQNRGVSLGGTALIILVCASSVFSTALPSRLWQANQAREYMQNATVGFTRIPAGVALLPEGVPPALVDPVQVSPLANSAVVMTPVPGSPAFADVAEGELLGFSPEGVVEAQNVSGPASVDGPDPDCGYAVTSTPRTIPLDGELIAWDFYARVAYLAGADTTLNLAVGGRITTVPLRTGSLRAVYFPVQGPGDEVLVSLGTEGVVACVTELRIGNRVSAVTDEIVPLPPKVLPDDR